MTSPNEPADPKSKVKYRDRPTSDGKAGDGGQQPNEGYPAEALDPDAQRDDKKEPR
jgi:hypothetical protein